jgi:hypothetical protein
MGAQENWDRKEEQVIKAFRRMNDDCQRDTLTMLQSLAASFPRLAPVSLHLVTDPNATLGLGQAPCND